MINGRVHGGNRYGWFFDVFTTYTFVVILAIQLSQTALHTIAAILSSIYCQNVEQFQYFHVFNTIFVEIVSIIQDIIPDHSKTDHHFIICVSIVRKHQHACARADECYAI